LGKPERGKAVVLDQKVGRGEAVYFLRKTRVDKILYKNAGKKGQKGRVPVKRRRKFCRREWVGVCTHELKKGLLFMGGNAVE